MDTKQALSQTILALYAKEKSRALSRGEIAKLSGARAGELEAVIERMTEDGSLILTKKEKYAPPALVGLKPGIFWASQRGYGFVSTNDGSPDLFIPPKATGGAWHQDRVLVRQAEQSKPGKGPEGRVERILSRGTQSLTGSLTVTRAQAYLTPRGSRYPDKILVDRQSLQSAHNGDLVSVSLSSYGDEKHLPRGKVEQVFGEDGTRTAACAAVLYSYGIRQNFPPEVLDSAGQLPETVDQKWISGRLDLRSRCVFTIDGDTAKDLDDAVSLEKDENGRYVLGVHIADVSHYVKKALPIDAEALARGTSVYYADKVIPMLPESLSNGICSLHGGVDRLTLSAFMTLGADGAVLDAEFHNTVIRSTERMTYSACNRLLEGGDAALEQRYANILPTLRMMSELSGKLFARRMARGALDIETVESYIECDASGAPTGILARERGVSERIIEEFMLCANEAVAQHLFLSHCPAVYRVHEKPDPDKMAAFKSFAALNGYPVAAGEMDSQALQAILDLSKQRPDHRQISTMLLRSLMKAHYSEQNLGHFGLAAKFYCHFTSPIRRYPDLVVHRFLKTLIEGKASEAQLKKQEAFAARAAASSSDREVAADSAERDIEKLYKAEYMQGHIGEVFPAVISGVMSFGFFVELENTVEGLVEIGSLDDDYYVYNEESMTLSGSGRGSVYSVGRAVTVKCVSASAATGEINFILA